MLFKLFFLLPATWLVLRLFSFNRVRYIAEFELQSSTAIVNQALMQKAQRYAEITAIAARHGLYKANCLHQSLALCWLLRRQNLPAQLRIGVLPKTQPFQAHAWVELNSKILGQDAVGYFPFADLGLPNKP